MSEELTRARIDGLDGEELDAVIAEYTLGYPIRLRGVYAGDERGDDDNSKQFYEMDDGVSYKRVPLYHAYTDDCFRLCEMFAREGYEFSLDLDLSMDSMAECVLTGSEPHHLYEAYVFGEDFTEYGISLSPSLALARALAKLGLHFREMKGGDE
jgi:hypothetical protein